MERVGSGLSDIGSPFGPGTSLVDDGTTAEAAAAAKALADGHPYLSEGNGNYAIDVYELMPVPM